jgi:hypothetical protein
MNEWALASAEFVPMKLIGKFPFRVTSGVTRARAGTEFPFIALHFSLH